jgi:hemerythrin-like domain-containing protein
MALLLPIESYAVNGAKPIYEAEYQYPALADGWYRIHDTLRAEMALFRKCLEKCSDPLEAWQADALKTYWKSHSDLVHAHHSHEENLHIPMLKERVALPEKIMKDHVGLLELLLEVEANVSELNAGGNVKEVLKAFDNYEPEMKTHFTEEETIYVPLMRAYFAPKYVSDKTSAIMKKLDKTLMGSFVHHQGSKADFKKFMAQEGIPYFVWYLVFKNCRTLYRKKILTLVQALLTVPPTARLMSKRDLADAINFDPSQSWKVSRN